MVHQFSFEKLEVWQDSKDFSKLVYLYSSRFPTDEKFGLTSQIRRASISVVSNIAEGSSRSSLKDQVRFLEIAYGSLMETYAQLIMASELGYLDDLDLFKEEVAKISNKINAFRNSLLKRINA